MKGPGYYTGKSPLVERFIHAFRGLGYAWQKEPNFRIEVAIAIGVLGAMVVLPLNAVERAVLVLVIALVLVLEILNSVFERVLDVVHPDFSSEVKRIKDTMAGAVLVASAASVIIAGFILVQPFLLLDRIFEQFLSHLRISPWVDIARGVTLLGGWQVVGGVGAAAALALLFRKQFKMLTLLLGGVFFGNAVLLVLKFLFARPRPDGVGLAETFGFSFPSGHVFLGTVFWLTLAYVLTSAETKRKYLWGVAAFIIVLIALSRVMLSVHWFSDIVGGILLGIFWFFFWFGINERLFRKRA